MAQPQNQDEAIDDNLLSSGTLTIDDKKNQARSSVMTNQELQSIKKPQNMPLPVMQPQVNVGSSQGDIQFYPNKLKQSTGHQLQLNNQDSEMAVTIDRQGFDQGVQEMSVMGVDGLAEQSRDINDTVIDESIMNNTQSQMQVQSVLGGAETNNPFDNGYPHATQQITYSEEKHRKNTHFVSKGMRREDIDPIITERELQTPHQHTQLVTQKHIQNKGMIEIPKLNVEDDIIEQTFGQPENDQLAKQVFADLPTPKSKMHKEIGEEKSAIQVTSATG